MKQTWAAPERNKRPIADVLRRVLGESGTLLEIASGSGQHAAFFSTEFPSWVVQPSDVDPENRASITAWVHELRRQNLRLPVPLDVRSEAWNVGMFDALFNANMLHIAPSSCIEGLMRGARVHLLPGAPLVIYGPFRIGGAHTAESNAAFDRDLRARDPDFGVRDLEQVVQEAAVQGLIFEERVEMPANNQTLIFRRSSEAGASRANAE
jgi:hypothetical protein